MASINGYWFVLPIRDLLLQIQGFTLIGCMIYAAWAALRIPMPELPFFLRKRIGFWISILLMFGLTGWISLEWGFENTLLAFGISSGLFLSLIHPSLALAFFITLIMIRPWEIMQANDIVLLLPRGSAFLAFGTLLYHRMKTFDFTFIWDRNVMLILGFTFWIAVGMAVNPNPAVDQDFYEIFIKSVMIFLLILHTMESPAELSPIKGILLISAFGFAATAFAFSGGINPGAGPDFGETRLQSIGLMGNSNDLAAFMVLALPFAMMPSLRKNAGWWTYPLSAAIAIFPLYTIWKTQSRAAIFAFIAIIALFMYLKIGKRFRNAAAALAILGLVASMNMGFNRDADDLDSSTTSRLSFWKAGVNMAVRNPLFGVGFGNFPYRFDQYVVGVKKEGGHRTAHSSWILVLGETGLPGFGMYMGLFAMALISAWRLRESQPEILLAVAGYGVSMSFLSHSYQLHPFVLFALAIASERAARGLKPSPLKESLTQATPQSA